MLQITELAMVAIRADQAKRNEKARVAREIEAAKRLRVLKGGQRREIIDGLTLVLRAGNPTKFEFEGACRHGLRASLILQGWKWADADNAAAEAVQASLNVIGAVRPRWAEGQIGFAENVDLQRYWCKHCARKIPDERRLTNYGVQYCDTACSTAASKRKALLSGERTSLAEWMAAQALKTKRRIEERSGKCECCGTPYITGQLDRKFCSDACAGVARRTLPEKPCEHCNEPFRAKTLKGRPPRRFCSQPCRVAALGAPPPTRECAACTTNFQPRNGDDLRKYCSPICSNQGKRAPRKRGASAFQCEEAK